METARKNLAKEKGESALEPWNLSHALSGDVEKCASPARICWIYQLPRSSSTQARNNTAAATNFCTVGLQ